MERLSPVRQVRWADERLTRPSASVRKVRWVDEDPPSPSPSPSPTIDAHEQYGGSRRQRSGCYSSNPPNQPQEYISRSCSHPPGRGGLEGCAHSPYHRRDTHTTSWRPQDGYHPSAFSKAELSSKQKELNDSSPDPPCDFSVAISRDGSMRDTNEKIDEAAQLEMREARLQRKTTAVIKIQSLYRGYAKRMSYGIKLYCIILIQSVFRRTIARAAWTNLKRQKFYMQRRRTLLARGALRARDSGSYHVYARLKRQQFHMQKQAALQAKNSAATVIQTYFRGYRALSQYDKDVASIIYCQSIIRRFQAVGEVAIKRKERDDDIWHTKAAATQIQTCFRRHSAFSAFRLIRKSVTIIQSSTKCYVGHRRASAIKIQSIVRRYIALCVAREVRRSQVKRLAEQNDAVTIIQASFRGFVVACDYVVARGSIKQFQAVVRGHLARHRTARLKSLQQATTQMRTRSTKQDAAATIIQACFRGFVAAFDFSASLGSIIEIQAVIRGHLARRRAKAMRSISRRGHRDFVLYSQTEMEKKKHGGCVDDRMPFSPLPISSSAIKRITDIRRRLKYDVYGLNLELRDITAPIHTEGNGSGDDCSDGGVNLRTKTSELAINNNNNNNNSSVNENGVKSLELFSQPPSEGSDDDSIAAIRRNKHRKKKRWSTGDWLQKGPDQEREDESSNRTEKSSQYITFPS